ncbi:MAG: peptide deformylase, partial [Firmicutes bacterium]|nr:peptide deformylase [Bacillota bacterium]
VKAQDRDGNMCEYHGEGLLARAFCHEIDHLDGKLYIDKGVFIRPVEDDELEGEDED